MPPTSPSVKAAGDAPAATTAGGVNGGDNANKGKSVSAAAAAAAAQQQSNSKASTVEAAIDYIKALQKEVRDCHVKIAEMEVKAAAGSVASPTDTAMETEEQDGEQADPGAEVVAEAAASEAAK